jgi:hypothetical protein
MQYTRLSINWAWQREHVVFMSAIAPVVFRFRRTLRAVNVIDLRNCAPCANGRYDGSQLQLNSAAKWPLL